MIHDDPIASLVYLRLVQIAEARPMLSVKGALELALSGDPIYQGPNDAEAVVQWIRQTPAQSVFDLMDEAAPNYNSQGWPLQSTHYGSPGQLSDLTGTYGGGKIQVIKEIRFLTGCGLKVAKSAMETLWEERYGG